MIGFLLCFQCMINNVTCHDNSEEYADFDNEYSLFCIYLEFIQENAEYNITFLKKDKMLKNYNKFI